MDADDLRAWATILQPLVMAVLGVIAWLLRSIATQLAGIRDELRALNGRMVQLEAWRAAHEPQIERRVGLIERRCEAMLGSRHSGRDS